MQELELNSKIQTPRDVARILLRTFTLAQDGRLEMNLKQHIKEALDKLLAEEGVIVADDLAKALLECMESFSHELYKRTKKVNQDLLSTRQRLQRTTDFMDKLQSGSYGQISAMLMKTVWGILQKELQRLKAVSPANKHKEGLQQHNQIGTFDEPVIDLSEQYSCEPMPFMHQPSYPDPKAYTPNISAQDLQQLEDLNPAENAALVDKILTNKKIIDILMKGMESKLAESSLPFRSKDKRIYRINKNVVGRSIDLRDKSINMTYDERNHSKEYSINPESREKKNSFNSTTRRPPDAGSLHHSIDYNSRDAPYTTGSSVSPTPKLHLDLTSLMQNTEPKAQRTLITPTETTDMKHQRPAILRDAKTLSTKFSRIIKDDDSISDGVYLLVDSELKKCKKKFKAVK